MNIARREFMGGLLALGACGCRATGWFGSFGARMRMGVLSDVHLHSPGDEDTFVRALEYFRDHGADAVLIAGDIADSGNAAQLRRAADAWFKIFPNDRAPDGRHVERLFIYGNHCIQGWTWDQTFKSDESAKKADGIGYGDNRARIWQEVFHEEFKPIWMKTVKGIPVIGAHWEDRGGGVAIEDFMKLHGKEIDPSLPFVYTQHAHPKDTCMGAWAWGHDDGRATRALSPFPNAVAFSGHSHYTLTDERSVWQGAFTSINTSSLRYSSGDYSLRENIGSNSDGFKGENRWHRMQSLDTHDGRQGMLVSFFDDHLEIARREFVFGESLGSDWIVPLPAANATYSYAARAKKRVAPQFPAGASVEVSVAEPKDPKDLKSKGAYSPAVREIGLSFPAARAVVGCRVYEYEVTAVLCEDDVELVQAQRRMMSPDFHLPASKLADRVAFTFAAEDLPTKGGHYRFEVRPVECFGKKGAALVSTVINI